MYETRGIDEQGNQTNAQDEEHDRRLQFSVLDNRSRNQVIFQEWLLFPGSAQGAKVTHKL
jgi:hypothetical protein